MKSQRGTSTRSLRNIQSTTSPLNIRTYVSTRPRMDVHGRSVIRLPAFGLLDVYFMLTFRILGDVVSDFVFRIGSRKGEGYRTTHDLYMVLRLTKTQEEDYEGKLRWRWPSYHHRSRKPRQPFRSSTCHAEYACCHHLHAPRYVLYAGELQRSSHRQRPTTYTSSCGTSCSHPVSSSTDRDNHEAIHDVFDRFLSSLLDL